MKSDFKEFDIDELSHNSGVTVRTIRYYIQRGLLPSPGAGRGLRYSDAYLNRLKLIRKLQSQHLPLDEIKTQLETMSDAEVTAAIDQSISTSSSAADYIDSVLSSNKAVSEKVSRYEVTKSATTYKSISEPGKSSWDRHKLTEGVELHVKRPASREQNRRIERIIAAAERILKE